MLHQGVTISATPRSRTLQAAAMTAEIITLKDRQSKPSGVSAGATIDPGVFEDKKREMVDALARMLEACKASNALFESDILREALNSIVLVQATVRLLPAASQSTPEVYGTVADLVRRLEAVMAAELRSRAASLTSRSATAQPLGQQPEQSGKMNLQPHILLAEDEALSAMAIKEFLDINGFRVSVAEDGMVATDIFDQDPADVLLTDIRMPRKSGLALIAEMRVRRPDLPVVVMTGHLLEAMVPLPSSPAQTIVLTKPFRLTDLLDAIRTVLPAGLPGARLTR